MPLSFTDRKAIESLRDLARTNIANGQGQACWVDEHDQRDKYTWVQILELINAILRTGAWSLYEEKLKAPLE